MNRHGDIARALDALVAEERVHIILAVESGSRAWGFESPDSDWDVRFIYARPTSWHVSLRPGRDVLERPISGDLDLSGWDTRKALNLMLGGNQVVREWLNSPIAYRQDAALRAGFEKLAASLPSRLPAFHHYRSLLSRTWERWLADGETVPLKKYLYAIRPALTLRWLATRGDLPPMDLPSLRLGVSLSAGEVDELDALLRMKASSTELGEGRRWAALDALCRGELERPAPAPEASPDRACLDAAEALLRRATEAADRMVGPAA